jgi:hypothetical protein
MSLVRRAFLWTLEQNADQKIADNRFTVGGVGPCVMGLPRLSFFFFNAKMHRFSHSFFFFLSILRCVPFSPSAILLPLFSPRVHFDGGASACLTFGVFFPEFSLAHPGHRRGVRGVGKGPSAKKQTNKQKTQRLFSERDVSFLFSFLLPFLFSPLRRSSCESAALSPSFGVL